MKIYGFAVLLLALIVTPSHAVEPAKKLTDVKATLKTFQPEVCKIGRSLAENVGGKTVASIGFGVANMFGVCVDGDVDPNKMPENTPSTVSSTNASGTTVTAPASPTSIEAILPAVQLRVFSVTSVGPKKVVGLASKDAIYKKGDGFALIMSATSSGYVEVWSQDENSETFRKADFYSAALTSKVIPTEGYFSFDDNAKTTKILIKFYPCSKAESQSFNIQADPKVAAALKSEADKIETLRESLPVCPAELLKPDNSPKSQFFSSVSVSNPVYSEGLGSYVAVNTNTEKSYSFVGSFELKRE